MSGNNDLTEFYTKLLVTNEVFSVVNNTNKIILEEERKERMQTKELSSENEYILSFTDNRKNLFLEIIDKMNEFNFHEITSLDKHNFNSFGGDSARYEILDNEIFLYEHTINVVIQMADMLSESKHPEPIIEIGMLLAFFHDFGKSPLVRLGDKQTIKEGHEHISSNYAKYFLEGYSKRNPKDAISKEVIKLIQDTLYYHHTPEAKEGIFLKLLRKADRRARDLELSMVKLRRAENDEI